MMSDWDPAVPGVRVRLHDNPGRQGVTTGRGMRRGDRIFVEVQFGSSEIVFKPIRWPRTFSNVSSRPRSAGVPNWPYTRQEPSKHVIAFHVCHVDPELFRF